MAALPYMQLYVAEYLADTAHLNAAQHGAYLLLIMNYWQRGKPLKNCNERLANVARMSSEEWAINKKAIEEFFTVTDEEWVHRRIEADLERVNAKSNKAKESAKASVKQRGSSVRSANATTNAERPQIYTDTDKEEDKESKKVSNKGSRFALTSLPDEWKEFCIQERPDLDPEKLFDEFADYWRGVPGSKGRKLDWAATWRNRVRDKWRQPAGKQPPQPEKKKGVITL